MVKIVQQNQSLIAELEKLNSQVTITSLPKIFETCLYIALEGCSNQTKPCLLETQTILSINQLELR